MVIKEVRANKSSKNSQQQQKNIPISSEQMKLLENTTPFKIQTDLELPSTNKSFMAEFKSFQSIFEHLSTDEFSKNQINPSAKRKKKRNLNQDLSL